MDFFREIRDLFDAGDVQSIVDKFEPPLPVFSEGSLVIQADRKDTETSIRNLMQAVKTAGATTLVPNSITVRPSRKLCANIAQVEWHYVGPGGKVISKSEINYYCGANAKGEMKIVMVEYIRVGVPQAIRDFLDSKSPKQVN